MNAARDTRTLALMLDWYRAMGVEVATAEAAIDWRERPDRPPGHGFQLSDEPASESDLSPAAPIPAAAPAPPQRAFAPSPVAPPPRPQAPNAAPARQFPTAPPDAAELAARTAAHKAESLDQLEQSLRSFDGCGLKATAKNLCFYRGAPRAKLMIIGEAPGRDEDLEGKPFVGRAGQLLDKMLAAIGLGEADVHITNIVYWRPPGNRTPTPQEAQVCRPFLDRQIELVAPDVIVLLGGAAAKHILNVADGIMRIRGKWREHDAAGRKIKTMATLHPAYLLRTPAAKRMAWRDLLAIRAALKPSS
jgi:DNA polymerase